MLTVRVKVLGCDGQPSEEIVQRAQSCLVVANGAAGRFRLLRIAQRGAAEFVAEFPREVQLGDLDSDACARVVEPLRDLAERCAAAQTIVSGLCLLPRLSPPARLICKAAERFLDTMCLADTLVVESCGLPPDQRPPVPEGLEGRLTIESVQAQVRVRTCDGFVNRLSSRRFVAAGETEVELTVDGCAGVESGVTPVGLASMSNVAIVGGDGSYQVLEFSPSGGLLVTEVSGPRAQVTLPETDLRECAVFSQETFEPLSTVWTRLTGSLALTAERTRGSITTAATVTRLEEVQRDPTEQERDSYLQQIERCLFDEEHETAAGFVLVGVSLMPLQKARVTASVSGAGVARFAALGLVSEQVSLGPDESSTLEITYDALREIYTGSFPFDFELPPGITLPDGIQAGPCLGALFTLSVEVSAPISGFGSFAATGAASYRVEILDE